MKQLSIIAMLISIFGISLFAQTVERIRTGVNLERFIGTWVYQSNDTIFRISIKDRGTRIIYPYAMFREKTITHCLFGGYSLQVNGEVKENNIGEVPATWTSNEERPEHLTILARSFVNAEDQEVMPDTACIEFFDQEIKHEDGTGLFCNEFTIQLLSPSTLRWKLDDEGYEFSVPIDVVMTKEEEN